MRFALLAVSAIVLAGCGYPGEPRPPALMRPTKVADLAVVERGAKIEVTFTLPDQTTEGLPISGGADAEVRIGISPVPWNQAEWEANSERLPVAESIKPAKTKPKPDPKATTDKTVLRRTVQADAAKYAGRPVVVGVRVRGPKGRDDGWSILAPLEVVPPLPRPANVRATDAANAVHLQWTANAPGFRIFRKLPDEKEWIQIGESTQPSYDDTTFTYGKKWDYYVRSVSKMGDNRAESDESPTITFDPKDHFPPAVPAGLIVIPGTRTIELVWDRVTDADLAGYRVYRDGQKIADNVVAPAYSDRDATAGKKYHYEVSSFDESGNESVKSTAVEATME
jgi:hypothetical protein